jgi:hypothetical protein
MRRCRRGGEQCVPFFGPDEQLPGDLDHDCHDDEHDDHDDHRPRAAGHADLLGRLRR